jgi:hypothetical protein
MKTIKTMLRFVICLTALLLFTGCNTLSNVKSELAKAGYVMWYPAEAGIEPGQIWQSNDGTLRTPIDQRPASLSFSTNLASFETLSKTVNANVSLSASFQSNTLGQIGALSAALTNSSVTAVSLDFGTNYTHRIFVRALTDGYTNFPASYQSDLQKVQGQKDNFMVIVGTVSASGLKYTFTCTNSSTLQANAPAIAKAINADFNVTVIDGNTAVWNIPSTEDLVIGVAAVSGDILQLPDSQIEKLLREQLPQMKKQNLLELIDRVNSKAKVLLAQ